MTRQITWHFQVDGEQFSLSCDATAAHGEVTVHGVVNGVSFARRVRWRAAIGSTTRNQTSPNRRVQAINSQLGGSTR
jgi:hypothetical protein